MAISVRREKGKGSISLEKIMRDADTVEGRVGWDKSAVYPAEDGGMPVAQVAATQEFGDPMNHIPSRSFMRSTISEKKNDWSSKIKLMSKKVIEGSASVRDAVEVVTLAAEGDISRKIATLQEPPLKDSTIAARLRKRKNKIEVGNLTKPLIDTGYMFSTLTGTVK